jgi:hypothetical protein
MVAQQKPKMVKQPQPKSPKKNANLTEATSGNPLLELLKYNFFFTDNNDQHQCIQLKKRE